MFNNFLEITEKYGITVYQSKPFKEAVDNGKMTDSSDCITDKIDLIIKHYPDKDIYLTTCESDEESLCYFCFAVASPVL